MFQPISIIIMPSKALLTSHHLSVLTRNNSIKVGKGGRGEGCITTAVLETLNVQTMLFGSYHEVNTVKSYGNASVLCWLT